MVKKTFCAMSALELLGCYNSRKKGPFSWLISILRNHSHTLMVLWRAKTVGLGGELLGPDQEER